MWGSGARAAGIATNRTPRRFRLPTSQQRIVGLTCGFFSRIMRASRGDYRALHISAVGLERGDLGAGERMSNSVGRTGCFCDDMLCYVDALEAAMEHCGMDPGDRFVHSGKSICRTIANVEHCPGDYQ